MTFTFEHLNLFDNNSSIYAPESDIWVLKRTSLYKFMTKIGFIHAEKYLFMGIQG